SGPPTPAATTPATKSPRPAAPITSAPVKTTNGPAQPGRHARARPGHPCLGHACQSWMAGTSPAMTMDSVAGSLVDQRAGALIREQFQQYRMLHLAVDDDDALHALFQGIDAGLDLRDHAAGNRAVGDQFPRILD